MFGTCLLWVGQATIFGSVSEGLYGRPFQLGGALARGALFATFMVAFNLVPPQRRMKRADGRTAT